MEQIKPGLFGLQVAADSRRTDFDFGNEQLLHQQSPVDAVFIGDSITQLWELYAYFGRDRHLVNRGIGGDVSAYVARRFRADALQLRPRAVILMIGTNDIAQCDADAWWRKPGKPEEAVFSDYCLNIEEIVRQCEGTPLYLCSVIPSKIAPPFDREMRYRLTARINAFLRGLPCPYVDYHSALTRDGQSLPDELSPDGTHVNARGYAVMARVLEAALTVGGEKLVSLA
jgi:lysophospholipase L1-like esterase